MTGVGAGEQSLRPRVLVCTGSPAFATGFRRMLEHTGEIVVVAVCSTTAEALALLPRVRPGLVAMDIELHRSAGLTAIEEIMSTQPVPILALSGQASPGGDDAAAALAAGALEVVAKSAVKWQEPAGTAAEALRLRIRILSHARVIRHPRARLRGAAARRDAGRPSSVIGICGSTGAPYVLSLILGGLPAAFPIPVLVVQHITPGFAGGLARWLDQTVPMPVRMASDGATAGPGAWVAPDGAHLKLGRSGRLRLDRRTDEGRYRPSGDMLFQSMADSAGDGAVAVVLTGMGSDGAVGAAIVRHAGGLAIAQDEGSSAIYGMPRAAAARGVDLVLPPDEIAACLAGLRLRPPAGNG